MDRIRRFLCAAPLIAGSVCLRPAKGMGIPLPVASCANRDQGGEIEGGLRKRCWVISAFWRTRRFRLGARGHSSSADLKSKKEYGTPPHDRRRDGPGVAGIATEPRRVRRVRRSPAHRGQEIASYSGPRRVRGGPLKNGRP